MYKIFLDTPILKKLFYLIRNNSYKVLDINFIEIADFKEMFLQCSCNRRVTLLEYTTNIEFREGIMIPAKWLIF